MRIKRPGKLKSIVLLVTPLGWVWHKFSVDKNIHKLSF
jgi:hypothetical protein